MKTIIFARVSTEEQKEAGNSLPAQLLRLQKYCKEKNLDVIKEFTFDESAYKKDREEFNKIIEILKTSKEKVALCCDKIDRLLRNFSKDLVILEELRKDGKIELHFPSDNIVLNQDSPATDLFRFTMGVSLAKYYSDSISDNVKRAYENKIKRGEWIGKSPIGYINTEDEHSNRNIIIDPTRSHIVVSMFEMYSTGNYSMRQIRDEVNQKGLKSNTKNPKPITISTTNEILKNPFYYGTMCIKGNLYPHKYPPLISKELFDRAQEVKAGYHKKPFKYASKPYIFRGMIKCAECGCTITPETSKGHIYYKCTNYHKEHKKVDYIKESDLLKPIYKILSDIQLSNEKIKEITEELKKLNESKNHFNQQSIKNLRAEYDKLEKRISNIHDLLCDGSIANDMFNKKLKEYKERQYEIENELQAHTIADEGYYITVNTVLSLAQRAYEIFESSEVPEKRQLLNFMLQNLELRGKKLEYKLKTPYDTVLLANNCSDLLPGSDSNRRPIG